jgi:4-amino-4-deoxy-L-arabinose transferase-like glycosyltransferase
LIRIFFWFATASCGFAQTWSHRFTLSPDGNNYLDIASAYLRGDYVHAINAYWSPMYSWLIAVVTRVFHTPAFQETSLLHLLNLVGVFLALRCFEYFFIAFLLLLKSTVVAKDEKLTDEPLWWLLGYGLFFSTVLYILSLEPTTPDVWVCVLTYLAMGVLIRIALQPRRTAYFALFGSVLGLGFLTKSFYFPLAFVFLTAASLIARTSRRHLARVLLALLVFAIVSGPFILAISKAKNRFTFGAVGKIGYAEFVNPIEQSFFWQGENQTGTPKHPAREILSSPRVFEFATPVGGSYPPSYDMSYWMDGVRVNFNVRGQLRILRQSLGTFFLIFVIQIEFAVGLIVLWLVQEKRTECIGSLVRLWPLWVPSAAACSAYSLVLVEPRYVAPFLVFLWLAAFAAVASASWVSSRRMLYAVVFGMLAVTGIKTAKCFVSDLLAIPNQQHIHWQVAQNLHKLGIQPGDRVAIIAGNAVAHWARLAGVKIVAELPAGQDVVFWKGDLSTQDRVFAALASTGSRAIVVKDPPLDVIRNDWYQLGDTPYYARLLPRGP